MEIRTRAARSFLILLAALAALTGCASYEYRLPTSAMDASKSAEAPAMMDMAGGAPPPAPPPPAAAPGRALAAEEMVVVSSSTGGDEMYSAPQAAAQNAASPAPAPPPPPPPPAQPGKKREAEPQEAKPEAGQGAEVAVVRQPMLIYIAGMWVLVDDVAAALSRVEAIARELGGYLARRDDASITIRVPSASFDEALAQVERLGEVRRRDISVEDVTEEFLDLEIRLKNLRAIRARLERLLEKATTVEEAVLLERELARVAGEIDRIEGRMKFLQDRATFSTITVHAQPRPREVITSAAPRLPVPWLGELGLGRLLRL